MAPIIFKCRMPPNVSSNHLYARRASGANYLKAEVVAFRRDLAILCKKAMAGRGRLEGGVMVHMLVGLHPTLRRDVDNAAAKNVLDALKGIAFGDDSVVDAPWPERVCDLARDEMIVIIREWTMRSVNSAMELTASMVGETGMRKIVAKKPVPAARKPPTPDARGCTCHDPQWLCPLHGSGFD